MVNSASSVTCICLSMWSCTSEVVWRCRAWGTLQVGVYRLLTMAAASAPVPIFLILMTLRSWVQAVAGCGGVVQSRVSQSLCIGALLRRLRWLGTCRNSRDVYVAGCGS